jgi:hypothetical protein
MSACCDTCSSRWRWRLTVALVALFAVLANGDHDSILLPSPHATILPSPTQCTATLQNCRSSLTLSNTRLGTCTSETGNVTAAVQACSHLHIKDARTCNDSLTYMADLVAKCTVDFAEVAQLCKADQDAAASARDSATVALQDHYTPLIKAAEDQLLNATDAILRLKSKLDAAVAVQIRRLADLELLRATRKSTAAALANCTTDAARAEASLLACATAPQAPSTPDPLQVQLARCEGNLQICTSIAAELASANSQQADALGARGLHLDALQCKLDQLASSAAALNLGTALATVQALLANHTVSSARV